ncbi:hypothetical protein J7373_15450 [Xanthomonas sp. A2111]|uniref:hypothetical protein n=1 Tax=Xanthomonas hawaiiensis TaxID=3003247 RepID=UPI001ADB7309|nr:hypothetical protein [Xanthomonas sp. A2111]
MRTIGRYRGDGDVRQVTVRPLAGGPGAPVDVLQAIQDVYARACVQAALRDWQARRTLTPAQRDLLNMPVLSNRRRAQKGYI